MTRPAAPLTALVVVLVVAGLAGCGSGGATSGPIPVVGAENEYADVLAQIGGPYVSVSGVLTNPNTDPHSFESSPRVATRISDAELVVRNGLGYDDFITKILGAVGHQHRVIDVQDVLGKPDSTANPHLWYDPATMPAVARAICQRLSALRPSAAGFFAARTRTFDASLSGWTAAIARLRATDQGAPVATTEPVADYLLDAVGARNLTPFSLQAAVMNGTDPSPQDVATERALLTDGRVKAFVYNRQVTDTFTESLVTLADQHHIPVVGVYETMPTPGFNYQSWMTAEVNGLAGAVEHGTSAPEL